MSIPVFVDGVTDLDAVSLNRPVNALNDLLTGATPLPLSGIEGALGERDFSNGIVRAADDGVVADGVTDNRAAMQDSINRSLSGSNPALGVAYIDLPPGIIAIDGPLDIPFCAGFEIRGKGKGVTSIVQHANNTPILHFATDPYSHTVRLADFGLRYATQQGPSDTNSACVLIGGGAYSQTYDWLIERMEFERAFRGVDCDTTDGVCAAWMLAFRDVSFFRQQGSAIRANDSVGKPNVLISNCFITNPGGSPTPTEQAISLTAAEVTIQNLDIENWNAQHLYLSGMEIPAIIDNYHMENSSWSGAGNFDINFVADGGFVARGVSVAGTANRSGGGAVYVFHGYGPDAFCQIEGMNGNLVVSGGSAYPLKLELGATGYVRGIRDGTYTDNPIDTNHADSVSGLIMTNGVIH